MTHRRKGHGGKTLISSKLKKLTAVPIMVTDFTYTFLRNDGVCGES